MALHSSRRFSVCCRAINASADELKDLTIGLALREIGEADRAEPYQL